ncbi:phage tail protein [Pontibacterium sp.]|uniref:phage tail-collar fiber domain-containing protein n=1 Tax=Pontibacterium sp. TaxID=2036026 RepID=UPI00356B4D58
MALTTQYGEAAIAAAAVSDEKIQVDQIVIGDGGGAVPVFDGSETALVNQVDALPVRAVYRNSKNPNYIYIEAEIPFDSGGYTIREAAAIDAAGNVLVIGPYAEIDKPADTDVHARALIVRLVAVVSSTEAFTLVHESGGDGYPSRFLLEAAQQIPPGATIKLGEDGRAYLEGPVSRADLSTYDNRVYASNLRYQLCDLGGLLASVQVVAEAGFASYFSFVGYSAAGELQRLHSAHKSITAYETSNGGYHPLIAPVPATQKVLALQYSYSDPTAYDTGAFVVDFNGGSITETAFSQVNDGTAGNNIANPCALRWMSEDADKHYYVALFRIGSVTPKALVVSVAKLDDSIAVESATILDRSIEYSGDLFRIDGGHFAFIDDAGELCVYQFSVGGVVLSAAVATTTRTTVDFARSALVGLSSTEFLIVHYTDFEYVLDEGVVTEPAFIVARTVVFSADYSAASVGDEVRVPVRLRHVYQAADHLSFHPCIKLSAHADGTVDVFANAGSALALKLNPDFSTGAIPVVARSAAFAGHGVESLYLFNGNSHVVCATDSGAIRYGLVSYSSELACKAAATPVAINHTGSAIPAGDSAYFSSIVPPARMMLGYSGMEVGAVQSETPGDTPFSGYSQIRRLRAVTPDVLIQDYPEFSPS